MSPFTSMLNYVVVIDSIEAEIIIDVTLWIVPNDLTNPSAAMIKIKAT
jgi:hypothetical protein